VDFTTLTQHHRTYAAAQIIDVIHPDDVAWRNGPDWYFRVGRQAFYAILPALSYTPKGKISTILDLASGCGRVSRHLRAGFPDAEITACDVLEYAVDFCAQKLGCRPLYSNSDLTCVNFGNKFDLIWAGSLFTHLPFAIFKNWTRFLTDWLTDDGILVITLHGSWIFEMHKNHVKVIDKEAFERLEREFKLTGLAFQQYTHIPTAAEVPYGISAFSPHLTVESLSDIPSIRIAAYTERGWADNQDILVVMKRPRLRLWGSA
jgi:SAM-dependent methyltransferase